ncbi:hypothetical protein ACE6H2_020036 [Prunus campanulata]
MVLFGWQAGDGLIALASITSSSIFGGVLAHGRPKVAYAESFLGKRSAPSVISTFAVMYFAEDLERLRVLDASKVRARIQSANKHVTFHVVSRSLLFDLLGLGLVLG